MDVVGIDAGVDPGPVLRRRQVGTRLRQLREATGKTLDEVAAYLECSIAKISRIETGRLAARTADVRHMLDLYGVPDDQREELLDLVRASHQRGWWQAWADVIPPGLDHSFGLIDVAATIDWYEATLVPGLFQTKDYAHAVCAPRTDVPDTHVDRLVDLRMRQQQVLDRDPPPRLHAVIDEAALRRAPSSPTVMRDQLAHLAALARRPNITIQVLPFSAGIAASNVSFIIFGLPDPVSPTTAYTEGFWGGRYDSKPEMVARFTLAFHNIRGSALDPDQSLTFLTALATTLPTP